MILLPRAVRVYFATQPTNLRQSFEGLTNQIADQHSPDLVAAARIAASIWTSWHTAADSKLEHQVRRSRGAGGERR